MFQLPIRRVMQVVIMLMSLVSISDVCQAEKVTMNDWKFNYSEQNEYRVMIEVWDDNLNVLRVYTCDDSVIANTTEYTYIGTQSTDYGIMHRWHDTRVHTYGGCTISQVWAESRIIGTEYWYSEGTPTFTVTAN